MATKRQAVLGFYWSTVERVATQGISFLVVLILARLLGPRNYGLVTLAATVALFGQMLLGETFSQALIQERNLEAAHTSTLFWMLAGVGITASILQFFCSDPIAMAFGQPAVAPIMRALSPLLLCSALQAVPLALLKRELDFRSIAAASTTAVLLGGFAGIALAFSGFGVWSLVVNLLVQSGVITIAIWRRSPFKPQTVFSVPHLRALWSYGQYTFLLRIAAFAANQSPRLVVGYLFGPAALGAFGLGLRIVEVLYQLLSMPATNVILPLIARIRHDPARLTNAILTATQLAAMMSVPIYIALAATAPILVPVVFGEKWIASVPLVQVLCAYGVVGACGLVWQAIIGGLGRPDISLVTTTAAAFVSLALLLLTSRWGLIAAASTFVARGYLTMPLMPFVISRLTGIGANAQYRAYLPVAIASAIMAATIELVLHSSVGHLPALVTLCAALGAGGVIYILAILVLAPSAVRASLGFLSHLRPSQNPT